MKRKNHILYLLLPFLLLGMQSCKPELKGQTQAPAPGIDFQKQLDLLIKDPILLEEFEIDEQGIRFLPTEEGLAMWQIYPEEYELTRNLLKAKDSEEMLDLLDEKGSQPWGEYVSKGFSGERKQTSFHYQDSSDLPLQGLKVALDPGHMAGNMQIAELEGKYVKMAGSPRSDNEAISFFEANLNLSTAHVVREELEKLGAEVFMSRREAGLGTQGYGYWDWKEEKWDSTLKASLKEGVITEEQEVYYRKKAPEDKIFNHFFVRQDLNNRARIINNYQPDLTLIIHYNVDAPNWLNRNEEGEFIPTEENYAMAFVPGSFMKGELSKGVDRVDFLRLLLSPEDIEASVKLSDLFLRHSLFLTEVPIVEESQDLGYLMNASILADKKGVYARNLSLSRMIKGPLVYGESLCQDNAAESLMFNQKDFEIEGIVVSSRVKQIAQAYINATIEYARGL